MLSVNKGAYSVGKNIYIYAFLKYLIITIIGGKNKMDKKVYIDEEVRW